LDQFSDYVDGADFGFEAWHSTDRARQDDLAAFCESLGGAVLAGFNDALAFASGVAARALA
jgi:hypothetical protein